MKEKFNVANHLQTQNDYCCCRDTVCYSVAQGHAAVKAAVSNHDLMQERQHGANMLDWQCYCTPFDNDATLHGSHNNDRAMTQHVTMKLSQRSKSFGQAELSSASNTSLSQILTTDFDRAYQDTLWRS
jgi:hypothetical protein